MILVCRVGGCEGVCRVKSAGFSRRPCGSSTNRMGVLLLCFLLFVFVVLFVSSLTALVCFLVVLMCSVLRVFAMINGYSSCILKSRQYRKI